MAYQVLARKYRPQRFSDVVGQDHVTRTLLNALAQGRIAHGYIFSGHRGIGKTTIARILAMALNCRTEIGAAGADGSEARPTPEPCGVCLSCTEVRAGNAVDVIEIDAATNRGIDEIRELRDAARYSPARDRYKVYILDEAHQITDAAFNALLKTLEEPPGHVVFMMATTQPEDIPQTIRSRCQHFSFHAVKFDDILIQLRTIAAEERIVAGDDALALLAEAGDGSMRDALSIMDQAIASAPLVDGRAALDAGQIRELMGTVPNTVFERLLEAISENQSAPVIEEINRLLNAGNSASQLARQFVRYLRNVLMARIAGERTELLQLSPDERARAARSALLFSEEDLTRFLSVMLRTFDDLNYRQEPRFHLELGLLKLVHLQRLLPVEQILSQLGGGPLARAGGGALPGGKTPAIRGISSGPAVPSPTAAASASGSRNPASLATQSPATQSPSHPASSITPSVSAAQAFSPFESDSRRKRSTPEATVTNDRAPAHTPIPVLTPEAAIAPALTNAALATPRQTEPDAGQPELVEPEAETAAEPDLGQGHSAERSIPEQPVAPVEPTQASAVPTETGPEQAGDNVKSDAGAGSDLHAIRDRVCEALEQAGHNTAASLLLNAAWSEDGEGILVQVGVKKTMLGLAMNAEAEKISREAIRALLGRPQAIRFVPGEGGAATTAAAKRPAPSGSVQARALDHPLVKQAQTLFDAEVRSVVDLRNK